MILSLYGSLSFVYGTIHSSALATCLFALIAMEIKASRLLKIYVCVLIVFAFFDFTWLCMYTTANRYREDRDKKFRGWQRH